MENIWKNKEIIEDFFAENLDLELHQVELGRQFDMLKNKRKIF